MMAGQEDDVQLRVNGWDARYDDGEAVITQTQM